ncbi:MAG TPA: cyclophane-forming radical SAM/SPASM peptide maturase GrrM/OscB [Terrimicrobiaceae bacterium]|nr:cyclophane-forming radical SAM/SPASM peptide maturase GrrM/OscB [Terrimicrobiaceae bacterium]
MSPPEILPWTTLLVLQASPFCNINCDYCYLPNRTSARRMSGLVLATAIEKTYASDLVQGELTVIWHAGEPLAVPISWYEDALGVIARSAPPGARIVHSIQSNGTLLNQAWCDFIRRHEMRIGLSIDGPAFLHDLHRKSRRGEGTHEAAMRGLRLLKENNIPFHVIAVITDQALGCAQEIYDFFESAGVERLGFNIEEVEADHTVSTLSAGHDARVREFYETIFQNQQRRQSMTIREFAGAEQKIRSGISLREFDFPWFNEQVRPFGIISVDWEGNFSTYSPELLGMKVEPYGDFAFGNVTRDHFADALETPKFRQVLTDIQKGIQRCAQTCAYYGYCGGGAPANKYYENGSFASTQTMYCRYSVQMPLDIVLRHFEETLSIPA